MQQITVKEEHRTRFHLAVDRFKMLQHHRDALHIRTRLVASHPMLQPPHSMRTLEHLQTAVLDSRLVDGDHAAGHICAQEIVIPVAEILMPLPRPADLRLLEHHLMVVMKNFLTDKLLHRLDDIAVAGVGAVCALGQVETKREPAGATRGVETIGGILGQGLVGAGNTEQPRHIFTGEIPLQLQITIFVVLLYLCTTQHTSAPCCLG